MKTVTVACQKFVKSIPATDEIHMEDRQKVWPELGSEPIRPMAYTVGKTVNGVARKQLPLNLERTK